MESSLIPHIVRGIETSNQREMGDFAHTGAAQRLLCNGTLIFLI
jgi:hypothetical protein